jgi:hypothetical protein
MSNSWSQWLGIFRTIIVAVAATGLQATATPGFAPQSAKTKSAAKTPAGQGDVRKLEIGKPSERELKGGDSHTYTITLKANS